MATHHRQVTGTRLPCERIRLPFDGKPVIKVFLDEDGRYCTNHPLLHGRFANQRQIGDRIRGLRDMLKFQNQPSSVTLPRSPPPLQSEKLVAGESASAIIVQEPDVSSMKVFLDTTSSEVSVTPHSRTVSQQTLQDPDVASLKEESITASPETALHNTIDGSSSTFPSSSDKFVAGATVSIPAVTKQDHEVSYLDKLLDKLMDKLTSAECITASPRTVPHNTTSDSLRSVSSVGSNILVRLLPACFQKFYIRTDWWGSFWTYPDVGGPFCSVDEADDAIARFLDELRNGGRFHEMVILEKDVSSRGDRMIHDSKYFLDGPPIDPNTPSSKTTYREERYLVQALLDQYNGDNHLFGDRAHELEDVVRKQKFFGKRRWNYHFNFTTKQQDNDGTSYKLFFAELSHMQGVRVLEVNCCRVIKTENNKGALFLYEGGGPCYFCKDLVNPGMQHPNDTSAYVGDRLDGCICMRGCLHDDEDDEDDDEDDEDDENDEEDEEYEVDDEDVEDEKDVEEARPSRSMFDDAWLDQLIAEL